ncbi:glycogen debranching protein [Candidatus Bathyarchaeota archaeon]|nr:glycogen debranching protein [Candidatus Korarchaeota archaeon]NIU38430.1 glycogen debranching protein [Candidatus Bathyarchaeota archaeon]NIW50759.1 glycogen debranching protein [Candidatus Korarchaeota archaeon]
MILEEDGNGRKNDLPEIYLGPRFLSNFDKTIRLEWIVTNGLGAYASSTALNINTRKYHGLLIAALNPPVKRHLLLAKMNEEIWIGDIKYPFYSDEFRKLVHPDGYKRMKGFSLNPLPVFYYESSGLHLKKRVFMPYQKNAVIIHYEVLSTLEDPAVMNIKPLVNSRHFYEVTDRRMFPLQFIQKPILNGVTLEAQPHMNFLVLSSTDGHYSPNEGVWVEKVYFRVDDSRGESCLDDNYLLGSFSVNIAPKERKNFYLIAAGGETEEEAVTLHSTISEEDVARRIYLDEVRRRYRLIRNFYRRNPGVAEEDWLSWLITSTDSFLVTRRSTGKRSVIAGYHWFEDWGRDALISLPGLTLVTGRFREAEEILLTFKQYCKNGLISCRFPDKEGDKPTYDSVDTTLWFFNAILQYLKYTGNFDFVRRELWETLQDILDQHIRGTRFGIHLDDDGLLAHGPRLTWMDVSINGKPVTPRDGKAVEVQALWYNALKLMAMLATKFEGMDDAQRYHSLADKAKRGFNEKFWQHEGNYLFDVINGDKRDSSLRPNQIIAVFLDFSMLDDSRSMRVVDVVWRNLWGTYGLKSLSKDNPRYVGNYIGSFSNRDLAYHNGTVWAWLLGPFVTAFSKVKNHDQYWRKFAFKNFMQPLFLEETCDFGLETLGEIFDGDPPHHSRGCIAQAWSVAEPLRAFVEDILLKRPGHESQILNFDQ